MSDDLLFIPLRKLGRSSLNVRKTGADSIEDLAASILTHGLIQNLTVAKRLTPTKGSAKTKDAGDTYEVVAGGRRLAALQSLAKQEDPKGLPCSLQGHRR
jgi:ParB-like chromosome segregation protein Spo0J